MPAVPTAARSAQPPAQPWHALSATEAASRLGVDPDAGLDAATLAARQAEHGANVLPEPPPRPLWRLFASQFASPLIAILFVAAALAVALGHHGDAAVIFVVVVINALVGSFQEGRAERSMAALRRLSELRVRVMRGAVEQVVPARELVPGDVMLLAAGDGVGADARLVEAVQLQVAEAALTGESVPVAKSVAALPEATGLADRYDMLYAGTYLSAGRARALVVATGTHTEVGRIAALTERATEPPTPLEQRLAAFGRTLVVAAAVLFVLVVALGVAREMPLVELLMVAISQMVSMVPEGLPVAMTIALAVGMQRMAARGAVIRRLAAVETLGSTTVICSDKTGTLTKNEMTAVAVWLPAGGAGRTVQAGGVGYAPAGALHEGEAPVTAATDPALAELLRAAVRCNDAELLPPEGERTPWSVLGDPTEAALLVLAAKAGLDARAERAAAPRLGELPFDAEHKLMATAHARHIVVKGAPEAVLRLLPADAATTATTATIPSGTSTDATAHRAVRQAAQAAAEAMAHRALRVLAIAVVDDGGALDPSAGFEALAGRARLLGLVGEIDPPREEARAAVAECRRAGVRVVMVTGDHKLTGLAIAQALGIAGPADRAVDGQELERLSEPELMEALPQVAVFARVQPAQKLRIVTALQARGEVVAMTGDGVNDAPALARADVGVAMGITGTEVAKSASRIVLTDDNFATLVAAVEQGRVVYANLKKVILFLFATSVDEVLVLLLALLAGYPLPLAAVQILWINIVTEGTLTVNLVMDPASGREMARPPVPRDDPLFSRTMLVRTALMALTAAAVAFAWFAWRLREGAPIDLVRTEVFTLVAVTQWFNVINCQSATASALRLGLLRNRWLLGGLVLSVALQAAVLYAPPLNAMFHTVPLAPAALLPIVALASSVLWVEELRKGLARWRARRSG